ncbi:MAG: DUF86 domain-containing protein [Pseudomonadota bacterium]
MTGAQPERHREYLEHVVAAIERIKSYTASLDKAAFCTDQKTQDAVIRNLEVIGEAARRILDEHPELAARYSAIPWKTIYAMRNRLSHGYFEINLEVVWETIRRSLPELEQHVRAMLQNGEPDAGSSSEPRS